MSSTADTSATLQAARRLKPGLAVLFGFVGLGYLYVGRIGLALAIWIAPLVLLIAGGWTRWLVVPAGFYTLSAAILVLAFWQFLHPILVAWRRPIVQPRRYNRWWFYLGWLTFFALVRIPFGTRADWLGYELYTIPGYSMAPTIQPGDWIVVDAWRYRNAEPQHSDLVVYRTDDGTAWIKRLVALPGDTLELRGRTLVRNGAPVDEPYLAEPERDLLPREQSPTVLGDNEYFVLGDHRDNSSDSRDRGPLSRDRLIGRVEFIAFPWSRASTKVTPN